MNTQGDTEAENVGQEEKQGPRSTVTEMKESESRSLKQASWRDSAVIGTYDRCHAPSRPHWSLSPHSYPHLPAPILTTSDSPGSGVSGQKNPKAREKSDEFTTSVTA